MKILILILIRISKKNLITTMKPLLIILALQFSYSSIVYAEVLFVEEKLLFGIPIDLNAPHERTDKEKALFGVNKKHEDMSPKELYMYFKDSSLSEIDKKKLKLKQDEWFKKVIEYKSTFKAAIEGNAIAQNAMGKMYEFGSGVLYKPDLASQWYELAVEQGLAKAQYNLGWLYRNGQGVKQNYKKSTDLLTLAAKQGFSEAQVNLGNFYFSGDGVLQDFKKAFNWFKKSAEQGFRVPQSKLGEMYYKGYFVSKDIVLAYMWLNISASKNYAVDLRNQVFKELSPQQISKGQMLANKCIEQEYKLCGY